MSVLKWGKPSLFQKAPAYTAKDAQYVKTADADIVTGKDYYTESSGSYTKVSSPTKASLNTYYEAAWTDMDTPKEGSLQLTQQDGQETTATEEGGDIVDIRYGKATYQVEWDEFDKDSGYAFDDEDGVVAEETALRWLPEDDDLTGVYIPRAKVRVTTSFNVADGSTRHYTIRVLKPRKEDGVWPKSVQKLLKSDTVPSA